MKARLCAILVCATVLTLVGLAPAGSSPIISLYGSSYLKQISRSLDHVGLSHSRIEKDELTNTPPDSIDILFIAYDTPDAPETVEWLRSFRATGGRLFTFFLLPPEFQRLTGIRQLEFKSPKYRGQFAQIRANDAVPALPPIVHQRSWNVYGAEPATDSVVVAAHWHNLEGQDTRVPAVLVGPAGAHLTHVLLDGNPEESGRLYAALIGHFFPDAWASAIVSILQDTDDLYAIEGIDLTPRDSQQAADRARQALARGHYAEALEHALESRQQAITARAKTLPSRRGEFRGVWLADPEGIPGYGWPQTGRVVSRGGFNAILVRFLGAAEANYPSAVLPVDGPSMMGKDRLQTAIRACRAQALELHVWKVCFKLRTADSLFVDDMRGQGRLQAGADGREIAWLCPSHPANRQLELSAAVEVVETYDIDGLHLDYIRFPHENACFDEGCRIRFAEQTGHRVDDWPDGVIDGPFAQAFSAWRMDQITSLVRDISTRVRNRRPGTKVSAAVFPDWLRTRYTLGQDWIRWIEEGHLDFVIPMTYRPDQSAFDDLLQRQVNWVDGRTPLYIGIGAWQLHSPKDLLNQIASTRRAGAGGFALFQLDLEMAARTLPLLDQGPTSTPTVPPHRGPIVTFAISTAATTIDSVAGRALYPEGAPLTFSLRLSRDNDISWSTGTASIQTLDGVEMASLGELRQGKRQRWWPFGAADAEEQWALNAQATLPSGDYRAVIHGHYRGPSGQEEYLRRGPLLRVRSKGLLDSLESADGSGRGQRTRQ